MDGATKGQLIKTGGDLLAQGIRLLASRPATRKAALADYPAQSEALKKLGEHTAVTIHDNGDAVVKARGQVYLVTTTGNIFEQKTGGYIASTDAESAVRASGESRGISLPTREETTTELKRRLSGELYIAEKDLAAGLKIAGKPCDCLSNKHTLGLEAMSGELIAQDPANPVYQDIIDWISRNQHKVTPEAIVTGQYADEYPRMANEFKVFRKRVMGSVAESDRTPVPPVAGKLTLDQAKRMAAAEAERAVEQAWTKEA